MAARLALPTLLSQVLVAFTIEFDNESEHRIAHSTTRGQASDSRRGPWLVSQAMWANFMQFIDPDGVPLSEVEGLAAITNLAGMKRWGYVVVEPDPADDRPEPLRSDLVVRPTRAGRKAQEISQPLADEIEQRWQGRFGEEQIGRLRESLEALVDRFDIELPQYLPVVSIHMFAGLQRLNGRVSCRTIRWCCTVAGFLTGVDRRPGPRRHRPTMSRVPKVRAALGNCPGRRATDAAGVVVASRPRDRKGAGRARDGGER